MVAVRVSVADRYAVTEVVVTVPTVGTGDLLAVAGGEELRRMDLDHFGRVPDHALTGFPVALPLVVPSFELWAGRCFAEGIKVRPDPDGMGCMTPNQRKERALYQKRRRAAIAAAG